MHHTSNSFVSSFASTWLLQLQRVRDGVFSAAVDTMRFVLVRCIVLVTSAPFFLFVAVSLLQRFGLYRCKLLMLVRCPSY
jgi:hypothetical protein